MTMQNQLPGLAPDTKEDPAAAQQREAYRERLRQALRDPEFRRIEGFPIAEDEDILALSDPPYYTACPNPFLPEILAAWQAERAETRRELGLPDDRQDNGGTGSPPPPEGVGVYHREVFAADVSEGKNHPIYNAHSYHTKVPHRAIMRYILHYTDPGDIVFDGFCGTGMTGVAAQLCADRRAVEELGYRVEADGTVYDGDAAISRLGARKAALVDLSPAATFIAHNYNAPADAAAFEREARRILVEVERECGWMYETWHPHCDAPNRVKGRINYTVWSDVFLCPACGGKVVFWEAAIDREAGKVRRVFACPHCGVEQTKRQLERAMETVYDRALGRTMQQARQVPVLINYTVGKRRYEKAPDDDDLALVRRIEERDIPYPFPAERMPEGQESRRNDGIGITHVHHFYIKRAFLLLACYASELSGVGSAKRQKGSRWALTAVTEGSSKLNRERIGGLPSKLSGTLYVSSMIREIDVLAFLDRKLGRYARLGKTVLDHLAKGQVAIAATSSTTLSSLEDDVLDYVFVDPPFGGNLMYSELNFLWEAWLRVFTNNKPEAIENKVQRKGLTDYQRIMERCFSEFYRVLKPGRWMTVEFHNSRNRVWNAIQEAILRAGFVVADVRTLDKQQGTFKQVTSTGAVRQDLIISAYKPRTGFQRRFLAQAGTPEGAWEFTRQHLGQLPTVILGDDALEPIAERQDYLLYDRMVAFHIQRGAAVPLSAAEFYAGLRERFAERDGMYFLPEQVPAYDRARLEAGQVAQLPLLVTDEKSTIQWLRLQLDPAVGGRPQAYGEILPGFLRQLNRARHENLPELGVILEQGFLQDEQGRWYVPDPNKASDLEKLRRRALLREFQTYMEGRGRLRQFRSEAVRAGFAEAWQQRDYPTIVRVAQRLPVRVLQEDPELLMYYDNASLRAE